MKADDTVLASRYGRALYQAAASAGVGEKVQADAASVLPLFAEHRGVFEHPLISASDKVQLLGDLLRGRVEPILIDWLNLLILKKRIRLLPLMVEQLARIADHESGTVRALVRTAGRLSAGFIARIQESLDRFSGKKVVLEIRESRELISGISVRMGDWVMDASARAYLEQLKLDFSKTKNN